MKEPKISYPASPSGWVFYIVGDVHGRLDCLQRVWDFIDRDRLKRPDPRRCVEFYLGDLIDRGPKSAQVVDALLVRRQIEPIVLIRGNHEQMIEDYLSGQLSLADWRQMGGGETLASYGIEPFSIRVGGNLLYEKAKNIIPKAHLEFFASAKPYFSVGDYAFVHAGIRPGVGLDKQTVEDLTWIREPFLSFKGAHVRIIVHGHTPVKEIDWQPNRINIDTGAYLTGRLSVLIIDETGAHGYSI